MSKHFAPNRGRFSVEEEPRRSRLRFNSVPMQIPDDFAAGMKSGLTSPSRPWFTLTLYDNGLAELENVKAWLTAVQDIMQGVMLRSNLYDQLFDVYKEEGIFGTGALLIEEDEEDVIHAQSLTIGSYAIGVDKRGRVNKFCRQFRRTLTQLASEFGESALPQELRHRLKEKPDNTRYELRNIIMPSEEYLMNEGVTGRFRYVSYWWLAGYNEPAFLRVGGYNEFPVMVPRWRVINDDLYGREQPGDIGEDDAAVLQLMEIDEREAIEKTVRPPVLVPESLTHNRVKAGAGGMTVYNPLNGDSPITKLFDFKFDYEGVAMKRQELTEHLREIFYVNMFRMWTTDLRQGRTATEIQARESEKMFMLGPLIERQTSELLEPMIERIYAIMERRGMFPPVPEELADSEVKIEYMSVLASTQKQASFAGIEQMLNMAGMMAQLQAGAGRSPDVLDKIDCDEVIDQLADMYVLPTGIVLGDDAVAGLRNDRKKEQRAMQEQQEAMSAVQAGAQATSQLAGAAKDISEVQMPGGGTGLEAISGMMNGGAMM